MKKDVGARMALYPMPAAVVGAMVKGKPNWILTGHMGIMGHGHIMTSLSKIPRASSRTGP